MTSAVTSPMRVSGWNVIFTIADDQELVGGIYQNPCEPMVTFGDVCAELALCFDYPRVGKLFTDSKFKDTRWLKIAQTASLVDSVNSDTSRSQFPSKSHHQWMDIAFVLTETSDEAAAPVKSYPSFISRNRFSELVPGLATESNLKRRTITYHIVHHESCSTSGSFNDHIQAKCIYSLSDPRRHRHPAFLPCDKISTDPRLHIMPLRRKARSRSQSPSERLVSTSPNREDCTTACGPDDEDYNMIAPAAMDIDTDTARQIISDFRMGCIAQARCCAISGGGRPWSKLQLVGPGAEVCHILPQQHYYLYPLEDEGSITQDPLYRLLNESNTNRELVHSLEEEGNTTQDNALRLCRAWEKTWNPGNGILLMKHIKAFFNARLLSIHPGSLRIRVFVPLEDIELYHGHKAKISSRVDRKALAHHYKMCCIENMAAERPNVFTLSPDAVESTATSLIRRSNGSILLAEQPEQSMHRGRKRRRGDISANDCVENDGEVMVNLVEDAGILEEATQLS